MIDTIEHKRFMRFYPRPPRLSLYNTVKSNKEIESFIRDTVTFNRQNSRKYHSGVAELRWTRTKEVEICSELNFIE